ncbi:hypothetical protein BDR26DRAFT_295653 [Obelidium mucronatum]|nr:hypothetical protein BDR26DRAFT_295653 [Obelidium mucronatum]
MLQSLPHEIKAQIAGHLLTDSRQSLFNLALCSHLLLRAALPLLWKTPRLSPLATPASWQRFLDAVAASHLGKTCFDYASWIQGVDDLGLFVGGEDEVDDSLEQRDVCSYAYPPETESDQTATQPNVSVVDALLERKDSKIEDVKTNEASPPEQAEEDHDLKIVQNEFSDLGLELEFTLDQPAPKARPFFSHIVRTFAL